MSPEEQAYAEALRRIQEAEDTGATVLDLSNLGALKEFPRELERLTSLQSLDLSSCGNLSGDLTPLAGLTSLQWLDLSSCGNLSGDLTPLAGLTSLQGLVLKYCKQLSDLTPLAGLTSLEWLDLYGCERLSGDLVPLAGLTSLFGLQLHHWCQEISGDLTPLAGLTSLRLLVLSGCLRLSDLTPLAGLTSLECLGFSDNEQLTDLTPLAGLTCLRTLVLSYCKELSDLTPLAGLTSLQSLDLSGCWQLSDLTPLAGLTSIEWLNLDGCERLSGDLTLLAGLTSLQTLNLYRCLELSGDLRFLAGLTSLQSLDLSYLSGDLTPLAGLTSLQTLKLIHCRQFSDLTPLAGLTSLRTLYLDGCQGVRRFASLKSLLPALNHLSLCYCHFDDLPAEVCGELYENVLDKIRAHYEDLEAGQRHDAEVKVLFLGNGGTGKTQLCRRLRGEPFDPSVPSTHAIQLSEEAMDLEDFTESVRLNLWDFGGQEIYHGSHALFVQGQAVFLILWTPKLEAGDNREGDLTFRCRPLSYWLDYLRAFAGAKSPVLLIQSQCDTPSDRAPLPVVRMDDFTALQQVQASAKTSLGLDLVKAALKEAVRDCFYRRPPPPIGIGRVKVRDRLRRLLAQDQTLPPEQRQHRWLERAEFDRLCEEEGGISDKDALLDFLHHNGVIFYRPGLFGGRIVLDQNWALEAIYALFDRKKTLPLLRGYGRFTRADLETLIWSGYALKEQKVFLGMMESCGICFRVRELPHDPQENKYRWPYRAEEDKEWEYLAPELLSHWSDALEQLLGRLRDDPPAAEAEAHYAFLHEGVLRGYLSKIGQYAKDAPVYWKYGCWFYEKTTKSQVLIESQWVDAKTETGPGMIRFRAWGERARQLLEPLLVEVKRLPVGQPPQIEWQGGAKATGPLPPTGDVDGTRETGLKDLEIPARSELPVKNQTEVYVSYAWGDDSSEQARQRTEVVERLCQRLAQEGWNVLRDSGVMRPGELISGFMKRIALADHVIVALSDKYLRSTYCMTELYSVYQRSVGEKEDFLRRIIPITLQDARLGTWRDRANHAKHWKTEFAEMAQHLSDLGVADFALYKAIQDWANHVSDMLAYVNDVLHPHGFEAIVKEDFAALRRMLHQARSERRA